MRGAMHWVPAPRPSDGKEGLSWPEQPSGGCPIGPPTRKHRNPSGRGLVSTVADLWKCPGRASTVAVWPPQAFKDPSGSICMPECWLALFQRAGLPCLPPLEAKAPTGWHGLPSI